MVLFLDVLGWVLLAAAIGMMFSDKTKDYWQWPWAAGAVSWGIKSLIIGSYGFAVFWFVLVAVLLPLNLYFMHKRRQSEAKLAEIEADMQRIGRERTELYELKVLLNMHPEHARDFEEVLLDDSLAGRRVEVIMDKIDKSKEQTC